jgi:peptidoglycan/xylan/chitin deacetylase (PgdA/CDA1 family)
MPLARRWEASHWLQRGAIVLVAAYACSARAEAVNDCKKPVYLTLDTGHMEVAPQMLDVLRRHQVKVTFFAANERTQTGDGSLGKHWGNWWKTLAGQGHAFASHTYDHVYWRGDVPGQPVQFRVSPSAGALAGRVMTWNTAQYCAQIDHAAELLHQFTGEKPLPLFRAPGGKTSPQLLAAAKACGYAHVGWSPAGFLGDELPSEKFSNQALLAKALREIRSGDILMAHLGIWSRKEPWAAANLEPLIVGLKAKGLCFETLRTHPAYRNWIAAHP